MDKFDFIDDDTVALVGTLFIESRAQ